MAMYEWKIYVHNKNVHTELINCEEIDEEDMELVEKEWMIHEVSSNFKRIK